jgi:hypothetical protein
MAVHERLKKRTDSYRDGIFNHGIATRCGLDGPEIKPQWR